MKKRWSILPAFAGITLGLASCYPGEVTSIQQLDVVVTAHDDTVTFTSFTTYALLDSVVHIDLEDNNNDSLLTRDNDALILSRVAAGMEGYGYTEETDPDNNTPDVILQVGALAVTHGAYVSYPWWDWWGWYPSYPCCGPGWGYYYPPGVGAVRYDVGTLVITMIDPARVAPLDSTVTVVWVAGINGLLQGSGAGISARITSAIDQAFDQSPYLSVLMINPNVSVRSTR